MHPQATKGWGERDGTIEALAIPVLGWLLFNASVTIVNRSIPTRRWVEARNFSAPSGGTTVVGGSGAAARLVER